MKTLIILLFVTNVALSQVYYSFETGIIDNSVSLRQYEILKYITYKNAYSFYADIHLGYEIKNFHVEANVITFFDKGDKIYFDPKLAKYDFRLYYEFKDMIKIGYEHSCTHPVYNSRDEFKNTTLFRASHDKIFIKYTFKYK